MKHFFIKQSKELQIEELYEKCGDHSLKLLFGLYRGSYGYLFLSLLFYVIKHSPAWILPIITAKVVDIAASGNQAEYGMIVWYLLFMAVMTIQNLPTSHLHVHFRSLAIRQIEAELLVRFLHPFAEKKYCCRRQWNRHQEHDKHDPAVSQCHRQGNPDA